MALALPAPGLARTFCLIIDGLCRTTASRIAADRSAGPLLVLIFGRLCRLATRLSSLVARIQAGPLPPRRPGRPGRPGAGARRPTRPKTRLLPESFAWLVRVVPGAAAYAGQVQAMLADPQTAALLEAAPRAGRILRPLCRMLAVPLPDNLRLPRPCAAPTPDTDPPAEYAPAAVPARPMTVCLARVTPEWAAPAANGPPPLPDRATGSEPPSRRPRRGGSSGSA